MVDKPIAFYEALNLRFQFQTAARQFGQLSELLETLALLQRSSEQVKHEELPGIGLGGGYTPLFAGADQQDLIDQPSHLGARFIGDSQRESTGFLGVLENQINVGALTRLRDTHYQRIPQVQF